MQHSMKQFITIKRQPCIIVPCMECCGHAEIVYAFQSIREGSKESKYKRITMAQWVNRLWNKFHKCNRTTFLCLISGAVHLVQPGLIYIRPGGWLADEIQATFEIF